MAEERVFDRGCRTLAETGLLSLTLAPNVYLAFAVHDSEHVAGEKLLHTELLTGEYHKTTLYLTSAPILPEVGSWAGAIHAATCEVWAALDEAITNLQIARTAIEPVVPEES